MSAESAVRGSEGSNGALYRAYRRARRYAGRTVRGIKYAGDKKCNLCNKSIRPLPLDGNIERSLKENKFPYSLDQFETLNYGEYLCPACVSTDRDRLCTLFLDSGEKIPSGGLVIQFAPSPPLSDYLRKRFGKRYRTADLFLSNVDDKVDITDMSVYRDGSVDLFICSHVLEHVPDDRAAIGELHRILAPAGIGIVLVPIGPDGCFDEDPEVQSESERWRRFAQFDHVRLYDQKTLCERLRDAGFAVRLLGQRDFGQSEFDRHAIASGSVLYVVQKTTDAGAA